MENFRTNIIWTDNYIVYVSNKFSIHQRMCIIRISFVSVGKFIWLEISKLQWALRRTRGAAINFTIKQLTIFRLESEMGKSWNNVAWKKYRDGSKEEPLRVPLHNGICIEPACAGGPCNAPENIYRLVRGRRGKVTMKYRMKERKAKRIERRLDNICVR